MLRKCITVFEKGAKGATLRRKWAFFWVQMSYEKAQMGPTGQNDLLTNKLEYNTTNLI
jgi:hypothetical protein